MSPQSFLPPSSTQFNNSVSGDKSELCTRCLKNENGSLYSISIGPCCKLLTCRHTHSLSQMNLEVETEHVSANIFRSFASLL